jgi:hypothetical protein
VVRKSTVRPWLDRWRGAPADARWFWLGYAVLLPIYLLPLCLTRILPGLDLPFHLALVDMLDKLGRPDSPYQPFYEGRLLPAPYMAHYLLVLLLGKAVPLLTAHKLVMAAYVAALPLSLGLLLHACGRSRLPALLAFMLTYNMTVHYGFISFALSVPVLILLLRQVAASLRPAREPVPARRWLGLALCGVALFLCHLQNYLFGLLAALCFVLFCGAPLARRALVPLALLPSGLLLLLWQRTTSYVSDPGHQKGLLYGLRLVYQIRAAEIRPYGLKTELLARLGVLPEHMLRGFVDHVDLTGARAFLLALGACAALGLVGAVLSRRARQAQPPDERFRAASALVVLGGLLSYFALPHHLRELELMSLYPRFAVLAAALAALAVPAGLRALFAFTGPRQALAGAALTAALVSVAGWYGVELSRRYRLYGAEVADFLQVLERTPPGGRAVGLVYQRTSRVLEVGSVQVGLPSYYPVLRRAPGSMVQVFYCDMRHMPCRKRKSAPVPAPPDPWAPAQLDVGKAVSFFDYFITRGAPPKDVLFGAHSAKVQTLHCAGTWCVYSRRAAAALRSSSL